jgi:hypothetical protein
MANYSNDFTVKVCFNTESHFKTYHDVSDVYVKDGMLCIRFKHNDEGLDDVVHKYPLEVVFRVEHEYNKKIDEGDHGEV